MKKLLLNIIKFTNLWKDKSITQASLRKKAWKIHSEQHNK
jgi:hypothetical protein